MRAWIISISVFLIGLVFSARAGAGTENPEDKQAPAGKVRVWEDLGTEDRQKLLEGEVIYSSIYSEDEKKRLKGQGQSMVVVNAPIDQCWEILTQYNKMAEYWHKKTGSAVIEQRQGYALILKQLIIAGVKINLVARYDVDEENHRIDYSIDHNYKHTIEDMNGYFLFEKIDPEKTLFTYAVTKVDIGLPVPVPVREALQKRDLPNVAINVKKRIESGGTWKKGEDQR